MGVENVLAVCSLVGAGVVNTVINKYMVSNLRIQAKFFIIAVQTGAIVGILCFVNCVFFRYPLLLNKEMFVNWIGVALSLITMIYSGLQASDYLSISLFTVLKNGAIPIVVLHDCLFFGYRVNLLTFLSFFLIALSSCIGTLSNQEKKKDPDVPKKEKKLVMAIGLAWMVINCISSASYSIRLSTTIKQTKTPVIMASIYTNLLAFPVLGTLSFAEVCSFGVQTHHILWVLFSGVTSCGISLATGWAASVFSSTTMTMVAALNKTPTALSGILFGIEALGSPWKWASVGIGALSGVFYAVSRTHPVYLKPMVQRLVGMEQPPDVWRVF